MPRTARNAKIDTRSARLKLSQRREPYWTVIAAGRAVGYRRGGRGGTWIARFRDDDGRQHYDALGAADDYAEADDIGVFSFTQAQEKARARFEERARMMTGHAEPADGPFTVAVALDDYFASRERRGSKGLRADKYAADARIVPTLGPVEVARLTAKRIRDWHGGMARAPKLVRSRKGAAVRATVTVDEFDPDAVRARRSTANRILTILKAALNHAFHEGNAPTDEPWRKVKPFREADASVVRYLSGPECKRLVNACEPAFREIVRGALLTGCRYGELTRLCVGDFDAQAGTIAVRISKSGKPRHVALNDEGRELFCGLVAGRVSRDLIFARADGKAWGPSHQQRPLIAASARATVEPAVTFHILRHSYASALAMRGVPMGVIAAQLGHADTRVTEKHYAHLAPSYVADTIRAALPILGIIEPSNVSAMRVYG